MTRRFAQDTDVPVSRSQAEVRDMLRRAGAGRMALMDDPSGSAVLMFEHGSRAYRLSVPIDPKAKRPDQEERRGWRLLVLLVKAKTQAILEGVTTIEREFLASTVMPSGALLIDEARPAIDAAMAQRGPLLLGFGGTP